MYFQPCCFRCLAMYSAFARTSDSSTVGLKQSQLFQPIGGVWAHFQNSAEIVLSSANDEPTPSSTMTTDRKPRRHKGHKVGKESKEDNRFPFAMTILLTLCPLCLCGFRCRLTIGDICDN